jgi:hypothetical protein
MPTKDWVLSRVAEMAREASETHILVKECQGDEQSSRDGKKSV